MMRYVNVLSALVFLFPLVAYCQSDQDKSISLKSNFFLGYLEPLNNPTSLMGTSSFTHETYFPYSQSGNLGYGTSLQLLYGSNSHVFFGLQVDYSQFEFVEKGDIWTGSSIKTEDYMTTRGFQVIGAGLVFGGHFIQQQNRKLSLSTILTTEYFISTKGLSESDALERKRYLASFILEHAQRVGKNLYVSIGPYLGVGLQDYFNYFSYKPLKYGLSIGLEYQLNNSNIK